MTVEKLMTILAKQDPKTLVVVPSSDHSYRAHLHVGTADAVYNEDEGYLSEHYDGMSLASDEKIVKVLVIE
jgi:hypothetical protein